MLLLPLSYLWQNPGYSVSLGMKLVRDFIFTIFRDENIRIYHECEGRIEKSVVRNTVWHHEVCRVMTNGDQEGQIFLS